MGLYHFKWRGKERTVSIETHFRKKVQLRFLDEEVLEALGKEPIEIRETASFAHHTPFIDSPVQLEVIKAVEESIGSFFHTRH